MTPQRLLEGLSLGLECFVQKERLFLTPAAKGEARTAGAAPCSSVDEPLAGLLPAAGGAPHVPVLHAVHLPALFALSPGLP